MEGVNTANALYRGWHDAEAVRGDGSSSPVRQTSSFTAINSSPSRVVTSQSSVAAPVQQNQARRRATSRRRHNPTVAEYLGLGSSDEPVHLEKYAPLPAGHEPPAAPRKRRKHNAGDTVTSRSQRTIPGEPDREQQLVSQSFHVSKPIRRSATNKLQSLPNEPPLAILSEAPSSQALSLHETPSPSAIQSFGNDNAQVDANRHTATDATRGLSEETIAAFNSQDPNDLNPFAHQDHSAEADVDLWQFSNVDLSDSEEDFDCGIGDDELLSLVPDTSFRRDDDRDDLPKPAENGDQRFKDHARHPLSDRTSILTEGFAGPNRSRHSQKSTHMFKSPLTQTSQLLATTGDAQNPDARKPIARPPFPEATRDRSPIIGLSSDTLLRTCFRIGEVINQSSQASKTSQAVIFELYARVLESECTDMHQCFTFCDLFHAKPPYIKGTYHATIWKSVPLFEYDGRRLLEKGRICRCVGTMKRVDREWVMTVLNIWEATWEDIKWVEGIVAF